MKTINLPKAPEHDTIAAGGLHNMVDKEKQYKRQDAWTKANIDRMELKLPKGLKEEWKNKAEASGLSLTQWIIKKCQGE